MRLVQSVRFQLCGPWFRWADLAFNKIALTEPSQQIGSDRPTSGTDSDESGLAGAKAVCGERHGSSRI